MVLDFLLSEFEGKVFSPSIAVCSFFNLANPLNQEKETDTCSSDLSIRRRVMVGETILMILRATKKLSIHILRIYVPRVISTCVRIARQNIKERYLKIENRFNRYFFLFDFLKFIF
jgi:hypothetical protein